MLATTVAERYKATQIHTSSPASLLVLLYDGMFRFLAEGETALAQKDVAAASIAVNRAHAILAELAATLRRDVEPELCGHLARIYHFGMSQLMLALRTKDPSPVADVIRVLAPLRDAWRTAAGQAEQPSAAAKAR